MNSVHAILIVIIRLWAAGFIVLAISGIPHYLGVFFDAKRQLDSYAASAVGQYAVFLIGGLLAWFAAPWLARKMSSQPKLEITSTEISADTLLTIGSFLIGIFYLAQYGPRLIIELISAIIEVNGKYNRGVYQPLGPIDIMPGNFKWLFVNGAIVAVASFMILSPAYLAKIFNWLRSAGHYEESDKEKIS